MVVICRSYRQRDRRSLVDSSLFFAYKQTVRSTTLDDLLDQAGTPIGTAAERAGITLRALLDLRRGRVERPRIATVAGLARSLGVDTAAVRAAIACSRAAASQPC